ncbi:hypothetical protein RRG08_047730 [Elysia crispata]|uniref:Uncharacterized protein n=1 Tax=Elysia crispata TaxID=231223 RepID=A0AAE1A8J2_9GAST|nr:hypothetical protein RRG08_047730 [Elysia crispata]
MRLVGHVSAGVSKHDGKVAESDPVCEEDLSVSDVVELALRREGKAATEDGKFKYYRITRLIFLWNHLLSHTVRSSMLTSLSRSGRGAPRSAPSTIPGCLLLRPKLAKLNVAFSHVPLGFETPESIPATILTEFIYFVELASKIMHRKKVEQTMTT